MLLMKMNPTQYKSDRCGGSRVLGE